MNIKKTSENWVDERGLLDADYAQKRLKKPELIFRYRVRAQAVLNCAIRFLGSSDSLKILDFGSAEGLTLLELNRLLTNCSFDGIEYSEELIKSIRNLPPNIQIHQGNIMALPDHIRENHYDLVSILAVLEHIPHPIDALREAKRILRPGGICVMTCPNPFWDKIATTFGLLKGGHHVTDMNRTAFLDTIRQADLELASFSRFMWAPTGILAYVNPGLSANKSYKFDQFLYQLKIFNWGFVNQCVVAQKNI